MTKKIPLGEQRRFAQNCIIHDRVELVKYREDTSGKSEEIWFRSTIW